MGTNPTTTEKATTTEKQSTGLCVTGPRSTVNDYVVYDETFATKCAVDYFCVLQKYELESDDTIVNVQNGFCAHPDDKPLCTNVEYLSSYRDYGKVMNCETLVCDEEGDVCKNFEAQVPEGCAAALEDGDDEDVQLFPSCSLSEVLDQVMICASLFMEQLPMNDQDTCRSNADKFLTCVGLSIHDCMRGGCPSVLDGVPGLRASYVYLKALLSDMVNIDDLKTRLDMFDMQVASAMVASSLDTLCPAGHSDGSLVKSLLHGPTLLLVSQKFLSSLAINIDLQPTECVAEFLGALNPMRESLEANYLTASTNQEYCRAYEYVTGVVNELFYNDCFKNDGSRVVAEVFQRFIARYPKMAYCDNRRTCVTGDRVLIDGGETVMSDNTFATICSDHQYMCRVERYDLDIDGYNVVVESGSCMHPEENYSCDIIEYYANERGSGAVSNCKIETCNGDTCTTLAAGAQDKCRTFEDDEEDVQVFPSCSMTEVMDSLLVCFSPFLADLPYGSSADDAAQCKNNTDWMIACVGKTFSYCLQGTCPTAFDYIPGFRSGFGKIREAFRDVESVEDVRRNFKVLGFEEVEEHIASMSKHMCPDILQKQESLHFWVEKSDFSLIAEEFLNSFGFNFVIPKIYDILPCNPMFSMMVRGLQRKVYQVATEGLSHDDVCSTYDMYVGIFGQMYRGFCKPTEVIDEKKFKSEYSQLPRDLKLTRTALKVLTKFFKKNPKLPKCTKTRKCVTGQRVSVYGAVTEDHAVESLCGKDSYLCHTEKFTIVMEGLPVNIEKGSCLNPLKAYTCADVSNHVRFAGLGHVDGCSMEICGSDSCASMKTAAEPKECRSRSASSSDVQLLPSCTISDAFNKWSGCVSVYMAGFPYAETDTCLATVDKMVTCLSDKTYACLLGRCSTVLDVIPGVRASYDGLRELLKNATGVDDLIQRLNGGYLPDGAQFISGVKTMLCPGPQEKMEVTQKWVEHGDIMKTLQEFLASLGLNLFIPSTREILPCAEVMMAPQLRNYQEAAQAMGDAKTHGEACSAYQRFATEYISLIAQHCSSDQMAIKMRSYASKLDGYSIPHEVVWRSMVTVQTLMADLVSLPKCN